MFLCNSSFGVGLRAGEGVEGCVADNDKSGDDDVAVVVVVGLINRKISFGVRI
jgi:hypothetical protein